jgi:hypothetical protein
MTHRNTPPRRLEETETRRLERTRQLFLLARAQLAAGRTDSVRLDAARKWPAHERRFS